MKKRLSFKVLINNWNLTRWMFLSGSHRYKREITDDRVKDLLAVLLKRFYLHISLGQNFADGFEFKTRLNNLRAD